MFIYIHTYKYICIYAIRPRRHKLQICRGREGISAHPGDSRRRAWIAFRRDAASPPCGASPHRPPAGRVVQ